VSQPTGPRVEINGGAATAEQLRAKALDNYGHFTAMQVRSGRTRGLDLHLSRLASANREMFGADLDGDLVRRYIRHALGDGTGDASVRVYAYLPEGDRDVSLMVTVRAPGSVPSHAQRLQTVPYLRSVAHIKHVGDFGQSYYNRLAARNGFDDALLTGPDGAVAEGGITNIGFFDGAEIIWPDTPFLPGITMQVLNRSLVGSGPPVRHRTVTVADLPSFASVFVTNSRGIAPVGRVDDVDLPVDAQFMTTLAKVYESAPWDRI
jgi:branched-subunit amino acid aminotransferase/4-amino-4-deoxychorismate lyase